MWLVVLKGLPGSGKSTIGRVLSKQLRWPLIDKDDARDLFENQTPRTGGLAYDIMFNIARRQLLQELSVICDSPLTGHMGYERAQAIAAETYAVDFLAISLSIKRCSSLTDAPEIDEGAPKEEKCSRQDHW